MGWCYAQERTLSLRQDKGKIHICIEDGYFYNIPKNLIWVELECSITMQINLRIFWYKLTKDKPASASNNG